MVRGEFLEGLNLTDAPDFDEWQFFQRDGLRQEYADVLESLSTAHAERGQWEQAITWARRWVALDRLHEPAHRTLIDLYARSGQRTAALRQYEEFTRLLTNELGQEPEQETQRLYEQARGKEEAKRVDKVPQGSLSFPLLKTKLYIPAPPASTVIRTHLLERLNEIKKKSLTIISAPAGFGKTTLLAEWIAQTSLPVAWLSLDNGDNDPYRFLSYLIAALDCIQEGVGLEVQQITRSTQPVSPHIVLAPLINDLGNFAEPYVLVLDDYQFITEHAVHESVRYLLDHIPATMHIVIASRADPPLQLGRLRAHEQMLELRTQDLRFTPEEVAEFLNEVMRLGLSVEDVEALDARTEGWVVGLKMAAISLRENENASDFIRSFSGSHRYVLDYLVEEVLKRQPTHIQTFLLETSILEKLNGPLCDTLMSEEWKLSGERCQDVLEYLERSNLFVIPLDDHKQLYRYHQLFADLLCSRLQQFYTERIAALHTKASQWFESNASYPDAIYHALCAQDFHRAAELIEQSTSELLARNELSTYLSWLNVLPSNIIQCYPWLEIYKAWINSRLGKLDQIELLLSAAESAITSGILDSESREMIGCIALVRANAANLSGNISYAIEQTKIAKGLISQNNKLALDNVNFQLGYAHFARGEFSEARQIWLDVTQVAATMGDFHTFANAKAELANLSKLQGKLHQAFHLYNEGQNWLHENIPARPYVFTGVLEIGLADSMREWNKLEEANEIVLRGIDHARSGGRPNTLCFGFFVKARILDALQDFTGAFTAIGEAQRIISNHALYPRSAAQLQAVKIRHWLSQGDLGNVFHWATQYQQLGGNTVIDFTHELENITLARVLTAHGAIDKALELLIQLAEAAKDGQRIGRLIEILNLQAIVLQTQNNESQAQVTIIKSLNLAEKEDYVRIFLDEGEMMVKLLMQLGTTRLSSSSREYVDRLLGAFDLKEKIMA